MCMLWQTSPQTGILGQGILMSMRINLPEDVKRIIDRLSAEGFEAFAVGGCVRDTLLGRIPGDWDITTSASPEQVKALFSYTIDTGIQHGTVTVMMNHVGYEVTTYRIDGEYEDARHPKEVIFTSNLVEDLKRRDFTINAMAYNEERGLVDEFGGIEDLKKGIIRCVGNPMERFSEDALRMLRAVRFAAQLGFDIHEDTRQAVKNLAPTIGKVSAERIAVELVKTLISPNPQTIREAYDLGLTKIFLPEFDAMMETGQNNKHHMYNVGEHTLVALQNIDNDKILRLTMLLHDIAKPVCRTTDSAGNDHFYGHEGHGTEMARGVLRRLKFDNHTTDTVCRLIRFHDERPSLEPKKIRKFFAKAGLDLGPMLLQVKRADTLGQSSYRQEEKLAYIEELEKMYQEIVQNHICVQKADLSVNGKDLIAMGMKPGKDMGLVIDQMFEAVLQDPSLNDRKNLLELANKLAAPFI